jgi:hypothetical protein
MPIAAKYAHTNLIARDWRVLAAFYEGVFGCTFVLPQQSYDVSLHSSSSKCEKACVTHESRVRLVRPFDGA